MTMVLIFVVAPLFIIAGLLWLDRPRKQEPPPALPLSPQLLQMYRDELVWNAMRKPKQKLRAGQSRRPL